MTTGLRPAEHAPEVCDWWVRYHAFLADKRRHEGRRTIERIVGMILTLEQVSPQASTWYRNDVLAERLFLSLTTFTRALTELRRAKLVRTRVGGHGRSSLIRRRFSI